MKNIRFWLVLCLLGGVSLLPGCGGSTDEQANTAASLPVVQAAQPQGGSVSAPGPATTTSLSPKAMALAREKARSHLKLEFSKINEKGYPMFQVSNLTGKDIDNIQGAFVGQDAQGNVVFVSGLTEAVPGTMFLPVGEYIELSPYGLKNKPEVMKVLRESPGSVKCFFQVQEITFMDGTREKGVIF